MNKIKEDKYKLELEVIDIKKQDPKNVLKSVKKNIKRLFLNKLDGKTGEC